MTGWREAYAARAQEYADFIDRLDLTDDRAWIDRWAGSTTGPLLDLGCGPGHWTAHLTASGHDVSGIDPVPEFVDLARRAHPSVDFGGGGVEDLGHGTSYAGVLAWYSLIHLPPAPFRRALGRVRDALRPAGSLNLGFFDGAHGAAFDHTVATAYTWSLDRLVAELEEVGWTVLDREQRSAAGVRPHAALVATTGPGIEAHPHPR